MCYNITYIQGCFVINLKEELKKLRTRLSGKIKQSTDIRTTVVKTKLTEEEKRMLEGVHKFREGGVSPAAKAIAEHLALLKDNKSKTPCLAQSVEELNKAQELLNPIMDKYDYFKEQKVKKLMPPENTTSRRR